MCCSFADVQQRVWPYASAAEWQSNHIDVTINVDNKSVISFGGDFGYTHSNVSVNSDTFAAPVTFETDAVNRERCDHQFIQ